MSVDLKELVSFTNTLLNSQRIKDYCPNGLQVEGQKVVRSIVGGVTASQALIDRAIALGANAILVHHGYFWKGEDEAITGIKKRRLKSLLENDISLLAYHLPLDIHAELGNNVQLAEKLNITVTGSLEPMSSTGIGLVGELLAPMPADEFRQHISIVLGRECLHIGDESGEIRRLAWCTGAAQSMISQAVDLGVDAYISGEISEPTVHVARETGIHYFSAGHHATERYGVQALGSRLAEQFNLEFNFVDIDNPV